MALLDSSEVAEVLGVSAPRVRQLAARGALPAEKVGGSWAFRKRDVEDFASARRPEGRPLSAAMAWAVLAELAGRDPGELPAYVRSRARHNAGRSLQELQPRLRNRAEERELYAHPSVIDGLLDDDRAVLGGESAAQRHRPLLMPREGAATLYVRRSDADAIRRDHGLVAPGPGRDGNVRLRVVPDDVWPFDEWERVAWRPVVAVDLLDASRGRDRLGEAAAELITSARERRRNGRA